MVTFLFWKILGLGLAIPSTIIVLSTIFIAATQENYTPEAKKIIGYYLAAILGWAIGLGLS